jgi:signal peptidase I
MNKDKCKIYALSSVTFTVLLIALFINVKSPRILASALILPLAVATLLLIRKRSSFSIHKKEVILLNAVLAVIFIVLREMTGLYFDYYKNPYFINANILLEHILPLVAIIVSSELIRSVLLAQNRKLAAFFSFFVCLFAEVLCFHTLAGIDNFNRFMDLVGLTLFPAITANVYYHYLAKRYGSLPNIVFRLITTLYIYFLPSAAAMPDALAACITIIFPVITLALISALYAKRKKNAVQRGRKLGWIATVISICIIIATAMLISCQFRFGVIVIATDSMTGEINKGDIILYERYDSQPIEEGQVIVFTENKSKIIHRVVDIQNIGGEIRYFTKGDANEDWDSGYRTQEDIFGTTDFKVSYAGYPTLWLRELLNSKN